MTKIGIMGAGAIGCYVGGRLIESGVPVVLVGRPSLAAEIAEHGLGLSDYRGRDVVLRDVEIATSSSALSGCDVVIVTVKSGDTERAAAELAKVLDERAVVVSFQNGVNNPNVLREQLSCRVLAGMVPFNVLRRERAHFHQGTSGTMIVERDAAAARVVRLLEAAGLPAREHDDVRAVLWGKLLVNLNNAVNALSGVPIREMLDDRGYRRAMAAVVGEGLDLVREAGIRPIVDVKLPPGLIPPMLSLPNAIFSLLRFAMPHVDPHARSSMWDDLSRGRKTEVDALNGEVVRLAERLGRAAPVNAKIVELVHRAEEGAPRLTSDALLRELFGTVHGQR